ncbi:nucleotide-binding protein [Agromyces archimandritae]|uniref:Nucleotide-binding protein n=1 Tax=Agromyces archimandritae TaxID=2781962 RepID=A0A975IN92_9MICO|nr:nucleotide-binding protein [Agromyces archimandritae]QTX04325.1 nucleotide-binding protein [Agromyces archimandritae]
MSGEVAEPWIFDTGPLSHFAKAGWLGLLKLIATDHPVLIPDVVLDELKRGAVSHPHLSMVVAATEDWIRVHPIADRSALVAFANYTALLVGTDGVKNLGECGVLALAETLPATAIVDDRAARNAASRSGVQLRGTAGLILDAVRDHGLPRDTASAVADDLLTSQYRLPFERGRFVQWSVENGLLEDE